MSDVEPWKHRKYKERTNYQYLLEAKRQHKDPKNKEQLTELKNNQIYSQTNLKN